MTKQEVKERFEKAGLRVAEGFGGDLIAFAKNEQGFCFLKIDTKDIERGEMNIVVEKKNYNLDLENIFPEFAIEAITKNMTNLNLYEKGKSGMAYRVKKEKNEIGEVENLSEFAKILLQNFSLI